MNRIQRTFAALHASRKKALCAYFCMGDPSIAESTSLAVAAVEAGADLLELGVPFSDPTADGPVIARAALRAIHGGATILGVIAAAAAIRARTEAPMVLFTYYNPILTVGEAIVVERARAAGIDALLVVDLPPEEGEELRARSGWPVLVGFGVDGPEAARAAAGAPGEGPDGVVVGTAIVKRIEAATTPDARLASVREFVADLRRGLDAQS